MKRTKVFLGLCVLLCGLLMYGCGSSGDDDLANINNGGGNNPNTGTVSLNFQLLRAVPANVDSFVFTGLDSSGAVVYGPQTTAKAAQITLTGVPTSVVTLRIDYVAAGQVVGQANVTVSISAGATTTINDPDFSDVSPSPSPTPTVSPTPDPPTGTAGTYILSGVDPSFGDANGVSGSLTLDAGGNVTGGSITTSSALVDSTQTFTVSGGSLTLGSGNSNVSGSVTTDAGTFTVLGSLGSSGVLAVGMSDDPNTPGNVIFAMGQRGASGASAASVSGTYAVTTNHVGLSRQGFANGTLNFDGAGGVSGTLTHDPAGTLTISGNYTVGSNGALTMNLGVAEGADLTLSGVLGNGVLTFSGSGGANERLCGMAFQRDTNCSISDLVSSRLVGIIIDQGVHITDVTLDSQANVTAGSTTFFNNQNRAAFTNLAVSSGGFSVNADCTVSAVLQLTATVGGLPQLGSLVLDQGSLASGKTLAMGAGDNGVVNQSARLAGMVVISR